MKKMLLVSLVFALSTTCLFSQNDSIDPEIRSYQRMRDSLYKAGLAKDSAFRAEMEEALLKTRRGIEESKMKELEPAFKQLEEQRKKEKRIKQKATLLTLGAFTIAIVAGLFILERRKQKRIKANPKG